MLGLGKEEGPTFASKPKREKNGLCCLVVLSREFSFRWISETLCSHLFPSTLHAHTA